MPFKINSYFISGNFSCYIDQLTLDDGIEFKNGAIHETEKKNNEIIVVYNSEI